MSKTQMIRDAIAGGKLPLSKIMEKTGLQGRGSVESLCQYLQSKGQVTIDRSGDEPVIASSKGKKRKAAKRTGKPRHKKAARKTRHTGARLRKIAAAINAAPPYHQLALQQLIAASKLLRETVNHQVEGLEDNPLLTGAMLNAQRAESLAEAA